MVSATNNRQEGIHNDNYQQADQSQELYMSQYQNQQQNAQQYQQQQQQQQQQNAHQVMPRTLSQPSRQEQEMAPQNMLDLRFAPYQSQQNGLQGAGVQQVAPGRISSQEPWTPQQVPAQQQEMSQKNPNQQMMSQAAPKSQALHQGPQQQTLMPQLMPDQRLAAYDYQQYGLQGADRQQELPRQVSPREPWPPQQLPAQEQQRPRKAPNQQPMPQASLNCQTMQQGPQEQKITKQSIGPDDPMMPKRSQVMIPKVASQNGPNEQVPQAASNSQMMHQRAPPQQTWPQQPVGPSDPLAQQSRQWLTPQVMTQKVPNDQVTSQVTPDSPVGQQVPSPQRSPQQPAPRDHLAHPLSQEMLPQLRVSPTMPQRQIQMTLPQQSRKLSHLNGTRRPSRQHSPAGRLSNVGGGLQLTGTSYEGFAMIHFELNRATATEHQELINRLLRYTTVQIKQPLLKYLGGVSTRGMAITVFAHIMAYMEIIPGMIEKLRHVYQILSAGISRPDIRDEIYCQLCKQINHNPDKAKEEKGWNLLLLCCSSFPPSRKLLASLEAHFQQVASGAVEGFTGDEEANRCYDRLQRVAKSGPRYFLPSSDEIEAIWSETQLPMEMFLPDGTDQVLSLHTMSTAEEVTNDMASRIGLSDPSHYGIFQCGSDGVEKLCAEKGYIIDMQSGWNRSLTLQSVKDWRLREIIKSFFSRKPPITEVDEANEVPNFPTLVGTQKGRLIFKKKLFLHDASSLGQWAKQKSIAFHYTQAVHEVMNGSHIMTERDAIILAALQLRADLPTAERVTQEMLQGIDMEKYGPRQMFVKGGGEEWTAELLKTMTSFPTEPSRIVRMNDYVDFLNSRCPLYQSTWFFVMQAADQRLPKEMFVAINPTGIHFANSKTKDPILHIPFTEVCSWGHSNVQFSIVCGNMTNNEDHRLITRQVLAQSIHTLE